MGNHGRDPKFMRPEEVFAAEQMSPKIKLRHLQDLEVDFEPQEAWVLGPCMNCGHTGPAHVELSDGSSYCRLIGCECKKTRLGPPLKKEKVADMMPSVFDSDDVNHPSHYTAYKGLEVIDLTEQMNFNRGNAVKYIARAGLKDPEKEVEDLKKAQWYISREIARLEEKRR